MFKKTPYRYQVRKLAKYAGSKNCVKYNILRKHNHQYTEHFNIQI